MKNKYGVMLEEGYQLYLNDLAVGDEKAAASHKVVDKVEVWDFIYTVIILCDIICVILMCIKKPTEARLV